MAENNCPYHEMHDGKIKKLEEQVEDLDDRFTAFDKDNAVRQAEITAALKNLAKIPETMTNINNTMITMQHELTTSNERLGRLETKVSQVDEDGKFNIRKWIKDNWIGLAIGLSALIYFASDFIKTAIK